MIDFNKQQYLSSLQQRIVPATLIIQAHTNTERIEISGVCLSMSKVVAAISQILESENTIVRCIAEADRNHRSLLLELSWQNLSTLTLLRHALVLADVRVEQVNIDDLSATPSGGHNPHVSQPDLLSNRPVTPATFCKDCRYYYGQFDRGNFLVCVVHPYGPEASSCQDWVSFSPNYLSD